MPRCRRGPAAGIRDSLVPGGSLRFVSELYPGHVGDEGLEFGRRHVRANCPQAGGEVAFDRLEARAPVGPRPALRVAPLIRHSRVDSPRERQPHRRKRRAESRALARNSSKTFASTSCWSPRSRPTLCERSSPVKWSPGGMSYEKGPAMSADPVSVAITARLKLSAPPSHNCLPSSGTSRSPSAPPRAAAGA